MPMDTLERPLSLVEAVCRRLAMLVRDELAHGERMLPTERDLAAQLGVSRSVIREAAKRLEMQGLIEIRQGVGIRAVDKLHKPLSSAMKLLMPAGEERLRQLVEIRFTLEPQNARQAAEYATDKQIHHLQATHQRLIEAGDIESATLADLDFHRAIAAASGNQIASLLMESLCDLLKASLLRGYSRVTTDSAIREHGQVLQAIARHDGKEAAKHMARHIHTTADELALPPRKRRKKKPA